MKYRKRLSTEIIKSTRIHHELVPCEEDEAYEPGSWELVARRSSKDNLESLLVSETTLPPGTITLDGTNPESSSPSKRKSSLVGVFPKRRQLLYCYFALHTIASAVTVRDDIVFCKANGCILASFPNV